MEYQISRYTNDLMDKLVCEGRYQMNSLSLMIPINYMLRLTDLNWNDIFLAFVNGYISIIDVIDFSVDMIEKSQTNEIIVDLACLHPDEISSEFLINNYLNKMIDKSKSAESKDKLLYIVLSFIFEKRELFDDPLRAVEVIYADFDYPPIIKNFVRFMVDNDNLLYDLIDESEYLFDNWKRYLINKTEDI